MNSADESPAAVLDEERQWTEPWGGSEHGSPCEKCRRTGITEYRCWSCLLTSATPHCPACAGRVHWSDTCPVCRGHGVVDGKARRGVSVYPRLEGLYHYMLARGAELDGCLVVELEGHRAPDVDFDADEGALLMVPAAVRNSVKPDRSLIGSIERRAREIEERV